MAMNKNGALNKLNIYENWEISYYLKKNRYKHFKSNISKLSINSLVYRESICL